MAIQGGHASPHGSGCSTSKSIDHFGPHPPDVIYILHMAIALPLSIITLLTGIISTFIIALPIIYVHIIMTPFNLLVDKLTNTPPDSYTPSKHKPRPPRRRLSRMLTFILLLFALCVNLTDGVSSPPKPAAKRRRDRFSSPQPRLFGDRDVNDLANSMGRSPMLDNNNNNEITMLKNRVDEIFGGVGNVKLIKRMKELLDEDPTEDIRKAVKGYLVGLLTVKDDELSSECGKHQVKLTKIFNNMKKKTVGPTTVYWMANFGEFLNQLTDGLLLANYAPEDDCHTHDHQHPNYDKDDDDAVPTNRIPRTNPCMLAFIRVSILLYNCLILHFFICIIT